MCTRGSLYHVPVSSSSLSRVSLPAGSFQSSPQSHRRPSPSTRFSYPVGALDSVCMVSTHDSLIPHRRYGEPSTGNHRRDHRRPPVRFRNSQVCIAGKKILDRPIPSSTFLLHSVLPHPVGAVVAVDFPRSRWDRVAYSHQLFSYETQRPWIEPATLDRFFDHIRSFTRVERLVISGLETEKFDAASTAHYFGHFAATVQSLELGTVVGTLASLFPFICAFPLVDDLAIELSNLVGGSPDFGGRPSRFHIRKHGGRLFALIYLIYSYLRVPGE